MNNDFSGFDISVVHGSAKRIRATIEINGVAQDISAWSQFWLYVKDDVSDDDADAVITKTLTGGSISVVDGPGGIIEIDLAATDTDQLSNFLHWYYAELKGRDGSGNVWVPKQGTLKITQGIVGVFV